MLNVLLNLSQLKTSSKLLVLFRREIAAGASPPLPGAVLGKLPQLPVGDAASATNSSFWRD